MAQATLFSLLCSDCLSGLHRWGLNGSGLGGSDRPYYDLGQTDYCLSGVHMWNSSILVPKYLLMSSVLPVPALCVCVHLCRLWTVRSTGSDSRIRLHCLSHVGNDAHNWARGELYLVSCFRLLVFCSIGPILIFSSLSLLFPVLSSLVYSLVSSLH